MSERARMRRHTLFVRAVVAIFLNQRIPKMHVTDTRANFSQRRALVRDANGR